MKIIRFFNIFHKHLDLKQLLEIKFQKKSEIPLTYFQKLTYWRINQKIQNCQYCANLAKKIKIDFSQVLKKEKDYNKLRPLLNWQFNIIFILALISIFFFQGIPFSETKVTKIKMEISQPIFLVSQLSVVEVEINKDNSFLGLVRMSPRSELKIRPENDDINYFRLHLTNGAITYTTSSALQGGLILEGDVNSVEIIWDPSQKEISLSMNDEDESQGYGDFSLRAVEGSFTVEHNQVPAISQKMRRGDFMFVP